MARKTKTKSASKSNSDSRMVITDEVSYVYDTHTSGVCSTVKNLKARVKTEVSMSKKSVDIQTLVFSYDVGRVELAIDEERNTSSFVNTTENISTTLTFEDPINLNILEHFAHCMIASVENIKKKYDEASKIL